MNWQDAFNERHEFDIYPDHFMTGMRNEFCAGWYAAVKAAGSPDDSARMAALCSELDADASTDCLKEVIDWVGVGNKQVVAVGGVPKYEIEIRAIAEQTNKEPQ